ncbi:MAG: succinate dehydrogenase assembly factor 2 [Methylococcales bacterium]|nr:succinate dehydrogenase assembly factor 2 [Methylococcales bacterium]
MSEQSQLYWQCRRGTKELDLLLKNYLENDYPKANELECQQFVELLKLDDMDLLPAFLALLKSKT